MWVLCILLLVTSSTLTLGCSCALGSLHQDVCGSKFIIRGTVQSEVHGTDINDDIEYVVNVLEVLKDDTNSFPVNTSVSLWTPGNDGICRSPLTKGVEYYLGGRTDEATGKLRIALCDFRRKSSELKQCQKDLIQTNAFDCSCTTPECYQDC